jgi:RNA polymerase sigma-70 factor (sigma-E family)
MKVMMTEPAAMHLSPVGASDVEAVVGDLYRQHYSSMVGLAVLFVDHHGEAEEVVQEAFVRLYASFTKLRDRGRAVTYLRRIVINESKSRLRRRRVARRYPPTAGRDQWTDDPQLGRQDDRAVLAAVSQLPRRQRECVTLRYYCDCTDTEIAAALGLGIGTVKKHLYRANHSLSTTLEFLR